MKLPKGYGGDRSQNTSTVWHFHDIFPTFKPYRYRPLLVLVVTPIIMVIISSYLPIESPIMPNFDMSISNFSDVWRIIMDYYNYYIVLLSKVGIWISLAISIIMFIVVYGAYYQPIIYISARAIYSLVTPTPFMDSYFFAFKKPADAITELRFIEKIIYFAIPVMIFVNLCYYISLFAPAIWSDYSMKFLGNMSSERIFILNLIVNASFIPLIFIFVAIFSRSFRFYLSKTLIIVAQTKPNKMDKMKYYIRGLKTYNTYLARILNIKLDELKIFSSLLSENEIDEKNLLLSFDDNDKLKPIKWLTDFTNKTDLVIQVTRFQMVKDSIEFLLGLLPLIFTILALALPSYAPTLKSLAGH